ncbi:MAG: 23S rRNA accumulation protein YceD [Alteromonadaceae bacterium]|nr:23S rRNA accumulation protein YceD [Alteromonadaceae bacterium]
MQKVKLPHQVEPVKSALKRSSYEGVLAVSDMERLTGSVVSSSEWVNVKVQFEKDAQGLTVFHGSLEVEVSLICQRCNEAFDCPLYVEFCYSPVQGLEETDTEALPEAYEPVEVGDHGEVNLLQLFEDELILALPIVPFHAEEACAVTSDDMQFGEIEPEQEQTNPFAVLKELKRDQE